MKNVIKLKTDYTPPEARADAEFKAKVDEVLREAIPHIEPALLHLIKLYGPILALRKDLKRRT